MVAIVLGLLGWRLLGICGRRPDRRRPCRLLDDGALARDDEHLCARHHRHLPGAAARPPARRPGRASCRSSTTLVEPVLDLIQTLPPYIYLLPAIALLGFGPATALLATLIVAMPPAIRLTSLGIRRTPLQFVELGQATGMTGAQMFFKIRLPFAMPSIMAGINQSLMMAFGMVVIAGIVGSGGLGETIYGAIRTLDIAKSIDAAIAIVILTMVIDRLTQSLVPTGKEQAMTFTFSPGAWLAPVVDWLNTNFHRLFDAISVGDRGCARRHRGGAALPAGLCRHRSSSRRSPGSLLGWRVGVLAAIALGFCFLMGLWEESMQTIALVTVSVAISVAIAFPLGILAARRPRFEAALRPVLDIMQTVPPWVYLIPAVMIFSLGRVPAIIATIVYGVPPMLRLTTLAFKQVPQGPARARPGHRRFAAGDPVQDRGAVGHADAPSSA